ncbi:unnamed protein product, partial [Brassica oleracea var. botrytis]|uniref:(rape) hypothetical protein n=1 Tax=Brassica napus TaxID=3708 RepID=A0A816LDW0_BRANA|nr:unnamed protein product [Brassica napus]
MVNTLCQSLAVALEAASSEAESHMALVIALAKRNAFTVEAYARLFVKSGLRILELGVVEGDAQKRVLAVQMLNFLMKYLNPKKRLMERTARFSSLMEKVIIWSRFVSIRGTEAQSLTNLFAL